MRLHNKREDNRRSVHEKNRNPRRGSPLLRMHRRSLQLVERETAVARYDRGDRIDRRLFADVEPIVE